MKKTNIFIALFLLPWLVTGQISLRAEDGFEFFQEEAKVTTASRREQSISESPVAIDVITKEEIRASGVVNIWDLLRYRVGMDVMDGRNGIPSVRAIVSVRGFPQAFAANLLVMVDGRSVYSPLNDGTPWDQLPVEIQDIERIEIVRGPNAALYGTGAGLGVINIFTKKSQGETQAKVENRLGNMGLVDTHGSVEGGVGKVRLRASVAHRQLDGYPLASTGQTANDFLDKNEANLRAEVPLSSRSDLDIQTGSSWNSIGSVGTGDPHNDFNINFQSFKLTQNFSPTSTVEVSGSRNDSSQRELPHFQGAVVLRELQYDAEILHRLDEGNGRFNTIYGMKYRSAKASSVQEFPGDGLASMDLTRGYLQQGAKLADCLSIQAGAALEHTNVSGSKGSYQAATVFTPALGHALRLSYSVAHTVHDLFPLFADFRTNPNLRLAGNPNLSPYRLKSYEFGYHGEFSERRLEADTSLFYTQIDNFHTSTMESISFPGPVITLRFHNDDDAIARGIENQFKYHFSPVSWIYANYTYEHITDKTGDLGLRTKNTPAHKVNIGGATGLGHGFSGSVDLGYKDAYFISLEGISSVAVPAYWRCDARLSYMVPAYKNLQIFVAGQNLFEPTHVEFADGLEVPRTYQAGLTLAFGGHQ